MIARFPEGGKSFLPEIVSRKCLKEVLREEGEERFTPEARKRVILSESRR
jgi:hypothetical protein